MIISCVRDATVEVSIHAPMEGAMGLIVSHAKPLMFQFTLPWRERSFSNIPFQHLHRFNSRSHGGSDLPRAWIICDRQRFQFTLPWRERLATVAAWRAAELVSIHAPMEGAMLTRQVVIPQLLFQFTLPWRERFAESMDYL